MNERIKISVSDDTLDACQVIRTIQDDVPMNHTVFTKEYRNRKPIVLTGAASKWCHGGCRQRISEQVNPGEIKVLFAKDGRNFLKNNYCREEVISLVDGLQHLLLEASEGVTTTLPELRFYLRIYLHDHPRLMGDLNLQYLTTLAFGMNHIHSFNAKNVGLWASCAQCVTPLHFDLCHGFLAQISGRKMFLLASADDSTLLHYWMRNKHIDNSTTSPLDLMAWLEGSLIEREKYNQVDEIGWFIAVLYPGDVLYTPPGIVSVPLIPY